jgi:DNA-binding IscR family transcriptional regulator
MLIGLLKAIRSHPLANLEELGLELNTSTNMIEEMVAELTKKGYLKSFSDCDSTCDHCPVGSACGGNIRPKVWMLTEKGVTAASK